MDHFLWLWAFSLWIAFTTQVFAQTAKIAVIGDPSLSDLVDLTTVQLSTNPDLGVLERADLTKVGNEQALKSMVASNDLTSVQLVPADGLVILRAVKQDGKTGIFARLVAVQPGVVLRESALSDGSDPMTHAKEMVTEFASYWPKLAQIRKGKISAWSLLGLRFELDGPQTREMERKINVLLASRLTAEPDSVVLERWRLDDALFDKSLNTQQTTPFWTGSSLIDGSMKLENANVIVSLRVRPSNGPEIFISDQESTDHLPLLMDRLAAKIQSHPMTRGAWQPMAEAEHYAELGKWCLDNRLNEQGAEAIESALALGDDSSETHRMQIRAYRMLTFADELSDASQEFDPYVGRPDAASLPARVKWGTLAVNLASQYVKANPHFSGQPGATDDPVAISLPVLNNCLRLLRVAYQDGYAKNQADETASLRRSVQNLIALLEPMLAKGPLDPHNLLLKYEVRYAPFWHESPEATIAYYRDLLKSKTDGAVIRRELFDSNYLFFHPACLLPEADERAAHGDSENLLAGQWASSAPRTIIWEDRPWTEVAAVWDGFVKELATSSDPVLQADALKFELSRVGFDHDAYLGSPKTMATGARFVAFLEQNQESLSGPRANDFLIGFRWPLNDILNQPKDQSPRDRLRVLGQALLKKRVILPLEWFRWMPLIYYKTPPEMARPLLASVDDYRQWYLTQSPQDPEMLKLIEEARRPLAVYAAVNPVGSTADSLTVRHHWPVQPVEAGTAEDMATLPFPPSVMTAENKIWLIHSRGRQIECVDPGTLQSTATFTIPDQFLHDINYSPGGACLGVTPQFLVVAAFGRVMLCSRTDYTWRQLDVPPSNYRPCWVNQQLYLIYDAETDQMDYHQKGKEAATAISGIMRVSLPDGAVENLVSTRRIPPQSPLDGKPLGRPLELWGNPAGLRLAVDDTSPHFQVYGTSGEKSGWGIISQVFGASAQNNDWASITTDPMWCDVKGSAGGELIGKSFDELGFAQIELMQGSTREVLLSNPSRVPAANVPAARWQIPDEIKSIPADVRWQAGAAMRGDDLCLYKNVMSATNDGFQTCLYYFAKGQKEGLQIPLKFQGNVKNPTLIKAAPMILSYQSVQSMDYGLVIVQAMGGVWVIPWSDIDAYRARVAAVPPEPCPAPISVAPAAAPPAPVEVTVPPVAAVPTAPPTSEIKVTPVAPFPTAVAPTPIVPAAPVPKPRPPFPATRTTPASPTPNGVD